MARKLIDVLNEFVVVTQDRCFIEPIDRHSFNEDYYLNRHLGRIDVLSRRYIFRTRYAFNIKTIQLLHVIGYEVSVSDTYSLHIKLPNAVIKVLNPLQISLDIHHPIEKGVESHVEHKTI